MPQHEVAHTPVYLSPMVSLNLACYVDKLCEMSGDFRDSSDNDSDDESDDDHDNDDDDGDNDNDDNDDDIEVDEDDDGDDNDEMEVDEDDDNDDDNNNNNDNDNDDNEDSGLMDIHQRALHRMVSRFITTKPCTHLTARIASLTGLDVDQTQSWFDKEHSQQPAEGTLFSWIYMDTGEPFPLLPDAYGEFFTRFYMFTKYTWTHRRCRTLWPGSHYWFVRVVELYWEKLQSKRYSECTVDLPSLRRFPDSVDLVSQQKIS